MARRSRCSGRVRATGSTNGRCCPSPGSGGGSSPQCGSATDSSYCRPNSDTAGRQERRGSPVGEPAPCNSPSRAAGGTGPSRLYKRNSRHCLGARCNASNACSNCLRSRFHSAARREHPGVMRTSIHARPNLQLSGPIPITLGPRARECVPWREPRQLALRFIRLRKAIFSILVPSTSSPSNAFVDVSHATFRPAGQSLRGVMGDHPIPPVQQLFAKLGTSQPANPLK